jgi:molecular chaperone GrpE
MGAAKGRAFPSARYSKVLTMKKKKADSNDIPSNDANAPAEEAAVEVEVVEETETAEETAPDYQALYEETKDKLLRHHAEFDNFRRRTQREFAALREQTKAVTVEEFLTVYDHFGMALAHTTGDGSVLRQGMEMILTEFRRTFENLGVEEMATVGEPFDPTLHEAIAQEASDEVPEGHVLRQWKSGFRMGERLLRPAAVVVSSGAADEAGQETEGEGAES